jgi:hypothetical protein
MNIVIRSSKSSVEDLKTIFGIEDFVIAESTQLDQLCKELNIFKSTSEARRNGRIGEIPSGYSEIKASKKVHLYIWNPQEYPDYEHTKFNQN